MAICVTGMHRSGTSLVARLLHELGMDLGPHDQLLPADDFNADGYWENRRLVELSNEVLDTMGGGWDSPPSLGRDWEKDPALQPLYEEAATAVGALGFREPWGWKDPRASLTLSFWRGVVSDLVVVLCVRHPIEVALSLQRRGASSASLALALWHRYNTQLLASLGEQEPIVVHYDRLIAEPVPEVAMLAERLGLAVDGSRIEEAAARIQPSLRHHGGSPNDFVGLRLSPQLAALYQRLCGGEAAKLAPEVAAAEEETPERPWVVASVARTVDLLQERDSLRRNSAGLAADRDNWRTAAEARTAERERAEAALAQRERELGELRDVREGLTRRVGDLEGSLRALAEERNGLQEELARRTAEHEQARETTAAALAESERESGELREVRDRLEVRAGELEGSLRGLTDERDRLRGELDRLSAEQERARETLQAALAERGRELGELRDEREGLARQAADLEASQRGLAEERNRLREELERAAADHEQARHAAEAKLGERDRELGELSGMRDGLERRLGEMETSVRALTEERDELRAELERLAREHEQARSRFEAALEQEAARVGELARDVVRLGSEREAAIHDAGALAADRDHWRGEARGLAADRDHWRGEARGLAADRDNWREEAGRLAQDRDNWRQETRNWKRETERLMQIDERRLSRRIRRLELQVARYLWWRLPRSLRDYLRPIIFKSARAATRPAAEEPESSSVSTPGPGSHNGLTEVGRVSAEASRAHAPPVSVLIPTLNAGPGFARLLAGIEAQEGVAAVELIVIDSGSTDGTPELAERHGARVERIRADEFGHGRTRNQAAELATHDVLLLVVQDAILLSRTACRDLARELGRDGSLAGVSARQVPRSESDLYGAFVAWSHDHVLRNARAELNGLPFGRLDPLGKRASAALDDVCAAVRRDVWAKYRFRDVGFAEDLDFAARAVADGWRFDLSNSVAVAHSHDRGSVYHLRRGVADRLFVAPLLGEPVGRWVDLGDVLLAAGVLLEELAAACSLAVGEEPVRLSDSCERLASILETPDAPRVAPAGELATLASFVEAEARRTPSGRAGASLSAEMCALLRWAPLETYAAAQPAVAGEDAATFVAKLAASVIGRALGDASRAGDSDERSRLLAGV